MSKSAVETVNTEHEPRMECKKQDGRSLCPPSVSVQHAPGPPAEALQGGQEAPRHAAQGSRPYYSPEYSPDFFKSSSASRPCTSGAPHVKAGNSTPLQRSVKQSVPFTEKKKVLDRQEEMEEVKQLDDWKPAVDIFTAVLEGLNTS